MTRLYFALIGLLVCLVFVSAAGHTAAQEITRKGSFVVYFGAERIGRHAEEKEAYETITNHALSTWTSGKYRIVPPEIEVAISLPPIPETCPDCARFDIAGLPHGTMTIAFNAVVSDEPRVLISQGQWDGDFFGVWTYGGQVHARLGGQGIYRPATDHLKAGAHEITVTWGPAGFGVAVDGEPVIFDPRNTRAMPDGDYAIARPTVPGSIGSESKVCVGVTDEVGRMTCPRSTLDQEPVPCA